MQGVLLEIFDPFFEVAALDVRLSIHYDILMTEKRNNSEVRVFYGHEDSLAFSNKLLEINGKQILYSHIEGIGYGLRTFSYSINLIPIYNSTRMEYAVYLKDGSTQYVRWTVIRPLLYKGRQREVEHAFNKTIKLSDIVLKERLVSMIVSALNAGDTVSCGDTEITKSSIRVRKGRKDFKELDRYGRCTISNGRINIHDPNNRIFTSIELLAKNAPYLPEILEAIYG